MARGPQESHGLATRRCLVLVRRRVHGANRAPVGHPAFLNHAGAGSWQKPCRIWNKTFQGAGIL